MKTEPLLTRDVQREETHNVAKGETISDIMCDLVRDPDIPIGKRSSYSNRFKVALSATDGREKLKPPFFTTGNQHYIPAPGLSVGERCAEEIGKTLTFGAIRKLDKSFAEWKVEIAAIINQEVNKTDV